MKENVGHTSEGDTMSKTILLIYVLYNAPVINNTGQIYTKETALIVDEVTICIYDLHMSIQRVAFSNTNINQMKGHAYA